MNEQKVLNTEVQTEGTVVEGTEEETAEKVTYTIDGEECSRSAYIRHLFNQNMSRQDIAKELNVKYYVVYSATANMYNTAHPEGETGNGRGSQAVPKVNADFKYVDAEGNVIEADEEGNLDSSKFVMVPRADLMRELVQAGKTRSEIKEYFGVAYATVYAATKDATEGTGSRERKMVIDPETNEEVKRADYIRKLFDAGMGRREIAKQVTDLTGELVDYSTVWAATKPKKGEEATKAEETEEATENPEEVVEDVQE